MKYLTRIEVLERYLDVDEDTRDLYFNLGLKLPLNYKFQSVLYEVDEVFDVYDVPGCPEEALLVFKDGHKVIVLENPNELYIRINDALNGLVEGN